MKKVNRFDIGQISSIEKTPQGFLRVPGFATRVGVFSYMDGDGKVRRELRHPDDVFDPESMKTLKNAVVTLEHPPKMVTPENVKQYQVGYTTDSVEVNRDMIESILIIAEEKAIAAVEGGIRELSSGYVADLEEESGDYNGAPYDCRQKNIVYNHVALVKRGRAGPEVRLHLDSADAEQVTDETKEVVISGTKVQLPSATADIVQDMIDRWDELRGTVLKLEEEMKQQYRKDGDQMEPKKDADISQKGISSSVPDDKQMLPDGRNAPAKVGAGNLKSGDGNDQAGKQDEEEEMKQDFQSSQPNGPAMSPADQLKAQLASLQAKCDEQQAKLDEYASKTVAAPEMGGPGAPVKMDSADVRIRVKLERNAEKLVPKEVSDRFDSMSNDDIYAAVIKHRHPNADLAGKSSVYLQSRFDSISETITEGVSLRKNMGSDFMNRMDSQDVMDPNLARKKMMEESKGAYKQPLSRSKQQ